MWVGIYYGEIQKFPPSTSIYYLPRFNQQSTNSQPAVNHQSTNSSSRIKSWAWVDHEFIVSWSWVYCECLFVVPRFIFLLIIIDELMMSWWWVDDDAIQWCCNLFLFIFILGLTNNKKRVKEGLTIILIFLEVTTWKPLETHNKPSETLSDKASWKTQTTTMENMQVIICTCTLLKILIISRI